jgi:hypothetical protein
VCAFSVGSEDGCNVAKVRAAPWTVTCMCRFSARSRPQMIQQMCSPNYRLTDTVCTLPLLNLNSHSSALVNI